MDAGRTREAASRKILRFALNDDDLAANNGNLIGNRFKQRLAIEIQRRCPTTTDLPIQITRNPLGQTITEIPEPARKCGV